MTPTNLGQLLTDQPAPTGLCQIKRGVAALSIDMTAGVGVSPLNDGGGGYMRISITPPRPGWWVVRSEAIWYLRDAAWYYWHSGIRLVPLDANGRGDDRNHHCQHSALSWQECVINTAYRLNAGVAYYAEMYWPQSMNAGTCQYHTDGQYHYIMGEFIEDGSL